MTRSPRQRLRDLSLMAKTLLRAALGRPPRFSGAYPSRQAALAALPATEAKGYDDPGVADVSFAQMCQREVWDDPIIGWLDRVLTGQTAVLDAGGHMGTKYIAFSEVLDLTRAQWTVYDMPGIVTAARTRQARGEVPAAIAFTDSLVQTGLVDVLLASGLLQYLDLSLSDLVGALPAPPKHILLNKVALRQGETIVTHERLGQVRVPYQIRSWTTWQAELDTLGYDIADRWQIADLGHVIPTHPHLGRSESWGFALIRR